MASEIVFGFKLRKNIVIETGCSDPSEERHQAASADCVSGQTPAVPAGHKLKKQTVQVVDSHHMSI